MGIEHHISEKWYENIDGNVKIELFKGNSLHSVIASSVLASDKTYDWNIAADQAQRSYCFSLFDYFLVLN